MNRLLAELKRRNVFRVGALYLVAGWLLLQVADILFGLLDVPGWGLRLVLGLLILGFPLVLIFSWVYEMTPEGIKRESEIDRSHSTTQQTGHKLNIVIVMLLFAAVGVLAWDRLVVTGGPENSRELLQVATSKAPATASPTDEPQKSIAVLPFVNMSADQDNVYFSDGLSEELLNFLAQVDGLQVAARTSSFKFRGEDADIAEIGRQLKVTTVLEGSVRKAGKHVRITAQLIDTGSGFHLWSETYDRDLDNIFQVQEEIARAIVDALKLPLLGHDAAPLSVAKAKNVEAYDLYLLGRHHARETTAAAFEKAIDYYEQAIAADPEFALAYSGLADAYMYLSDYGGIAITDADRAAEPAVRRALELDPRSAEPYASMGLILDYRGRASDALEYFEKALAINPNYVNALLWKSNVLRDTGRHLDALAMNERAYELDPLSGFVNARLVGAAMSAGQFARAESLIAEMRDANPDDPFPYEEAGNLWYMRGELDRAVPDYVMAHRLRPGDTYMAWRLVQSFMRLDDESGTRAWLEEAERRGPEAIYTIRARAEYLRSMADANDYLAYALERAGLEPDNALLLGEVGLARFMTGDLEGAETDLQAALSLAGYRPADGVLVANQASAALLLAAVLSVQGESAEADKLLSELDDLREVLKLQQPAGTGSPLIEAFTAAIGGDRGRMLEAFDRAVERGFRGHRTLLRDPVLRPYLDDPDFQTLIERMRGDEAEMRQRLAASGVARLP